VSGHSKRCHETAPRRATPAATTRKPDLKIQLIQLAKGFLRLSVGLERIMAPWTRADRLRPRRVSSPRRDHRMGLEHLEEANRHVAESERLAADWRDLIDRMQAEGRAVAVARNLLATFQGNVEAHRSNRDLIQRMIAEGQSGSSSEQ
jgi:hypothetical protein